SAFSRSFLTCLAIQSRKRFSEPALQLITELLRLNRRIQEFRIRLISSAAQTRIRFSGAPTRVGGNGSDRSRGMPEQFGRPGGSTPGTKHARNRSCRVPDPAS